MQRKYFLVPAALIAWLGIAGCAAPVRGPVSVVNLGLRADSATGAMMVSEGDTLWSISQRYRLPLREIIDKNNLAPPYALATGQRLKLPAPVEYRVRGGDTLTSIATMFGVGVYKLVQTNNLKEPYNINQGQDLRIPSSSVAARQTVAAKPLSPQQPSEKIRSLAAPVEVASESLPVQTTLHVSKRPDFTWPVRGKVISAYGPKKGGLYNDGINIAAPKGSPVAAAAAGVVAYVGDDLKSYGNLVLIRHSGGRMTAYAHLASHTVKKGMKVRKGQVIGAVGSTGGVSVSQLHFEIRQGAKTHDPKKYLG